MRRNARDGIATHTQRPMHQPQAIPLRERRSLRIHLTNHASNSLSTKSHHEDTSYRLINPAWNVGDRSECRGRRSLSFWLRVWIQNLLSFIRLPLLPTVPQLRIRSPILLLAFALLLQRSLLSSVRRTKFNRPLRLLNPERRLVSEAPLFLHSRSEFFLLGKSSVRLTGEDSDIPFADRRNSRYVGYLPAS